MNLRSKLLLAPIMAATLVFAIAAINTLALRNSTLSTQADLVADIESLRTLSSVQEQVGAIHAGLYRTLGLPEGKEAAAQAYRDSTSVQLQGLKRTLSSIEEAKTYGPQLNAALKSASQELDTYRERVHEALSGATTQVAESAYTSLSKAIATAVVSLDEFTSSSIQASNHRSSQASLLLGAVGLLASAASVAVAWSMQRKIVDDLLRAVNVTREVAAGNLAANVHTDRHDEVGNLMRALGAMTQQLSRSLHTVLTSSSSIQSASSEIAIGNQDLSHRTEQTASNLQLASSSMEQLTGTVKQSANSARQANQLAASAAEVAAVGGTVVSQVVTTMDEINSSSKKISEIIGVIDGIAFQTNILALNAAVEAARAGEQGRGFAVVASEVRSLAGRSADAAREIKTLIGASVERVEAGSRLVADAGRTMSEIVRSVQQVSDIIGEITAASAEQSDGISLVTGSVTELDKMTQQNAALVEQSAAAAESLKSQADRLAQVVGAFRLQPSEQSVDAQVKLVSKPKVTAKVTAPAPAPAKEIAKVAPIATAAAPARSVVKVAPPPAASRTAPQPAQAGTDDWESF